MEISISNPRYVLKLSNGKFPSFELKNVRQKMKTLGSGRLTIIAVHTFTVIIQ